MGTMSFQYGVKQERDWNAGSIERYMEGYWKSDSVRFASGGHVTYGWRNTLARYKMGYPDRKAMGTLTFSGVHVTVLSGDAALAFGTWKLARGQDAPWGLFTLLFRRLPEGWRITADHTSLAGS